MLFTGKSLPEEGYIFIFCISSGEGILVLPIQVIQVSLFFGFLVLLGVHSCGPVRSKMAIICTYPAKIMDR